MYSSFLWRIAKGNHDSWEGGAGGEEPLATAKSAHKVATSLSTSNKSCPCAAWTVKTISNIARKEEVLDVDGGGSTAAVGSTKSSAVGSPKGEALDASPVEDSTRGRLELAFN